MRKLGKFGLSFLIALGCVFTVSETFATSIKPPIPANFDNGIMPARKLKANVLVDSIAIHKGEREMQVFRKGRLLKTYSIHLGLNPVGPKRCLGDYRTPEGLYFINVKNANSQFHKSLGISYPNATDVHRASKIGLKPGGDIMIHGLPNGEEEAGPDRYQNDWTWGCIAISNHEIEELFDHIEIRTPVLITP